MRSTLGMFHSAGYGLSLLNLDRLYVHQQNKIKHNFLNQIH